MVKKIVGARETMSLGPRGELVRMVEYEFMLDDFGPFIASWPKTEDSAERLKEAIKKQELILTEAMK